MFRLGRAELRIFRYNVSLRWRQKKTRIFQIFRDTFWLPDILSKHTRFVTFSWLKDRLQLHETQKNRLKSFIQ